MHWPLRSVVDRKVIEFMDKAAKYGFPWRYMVGGFQEVIVEDLPGQLDESGEQLVRITHATAEVWDLHPLGQKEADKKIIPKWLLVRSVVA